MTKRPKLYPGHTHDWQPQLVGELMRCTICGLEMPRALVDLDQPRTQEKPT